MAERISFEFYFNAFCGGKAGVIPAESFDRCIMLAEREVNSYFHRDADIEKYQKDIWSCICEVAETVYFRERSGDVKSETIDGYSVTFADSAESEGKIRKIVFQRLGNTGLLYAGVE